MITEAKNKAGRPRKKKAATVVEKPAEEIKELIGPTATSTEATLGDVKAALKGSCPACHMTVTLSQQYRCQNCGVYGCEECGFDPKAKICPKCGAKR
jgi:predicted RNA-binding Zn-ribbon protein involved in translation (DUF1610 family)